MNPLTVIAIADGLLSLLEKLAPDLQKALQSGQVPKERQAAIRQRYDALRQDAAFSGPEWETDKLSPG